MFALQVRGLRLASTTVGRGVITATRNGRSFVAASKASQGNDTYVRLGFAAVGVSSGVALGVVVAEVPSIRSVALELGLAAGVGTWLVVNRSPYPWMKEIAILSSVCSLGAFFFASRVNAALDDMVVEEGGSEVEETVQGVPYSKFLYLVPIAIAPLAHNLVTLASKQRSIKQTQTYLALAVAVTAGAIFQRVFLMEQVGLSLQSSASDQMIEQQQNCKH